MGGLLLPESHKHKLAFQCRWEGIYKEIKWIKTKIQRLLVNIQIIS